MATMEEVKKREDYSFECNISKEDCESESNYAEWGCAYIWAGENIGVEYNLCIEEGVEGPINSSAIYKIGMNEKTGNMQTYTDEFEHYEIDFKNEHWKEELEAAMCEALIHFYSEVPTKEHLLSYIKKEAADRNFTDLRITNIRFLETGAVLADISYTWRLNGWDKKAEHKDAVFVFATEGNRWISTIFFLRGIEEE